ncbi:MAG TPA: 4-hydroxy-3-methylbut-2-en-1-yl diphosphate synthase [Ruminococcaceae bacterium]|nr:4-hydroxy-3-methylbut-2-en-1-yl diphosphate synthase [Oscillospiraceae bacterium]
MKKTREVKVGNLSIGGGHPIAVQSMLNRDPHDVSVCVAQALELQAAGCEIIRTTVPDLESVSVIDALKKEVSVPIVADIHFDYRIALACAEHGVDKIRINPGNIGDDDRVGQVARACKQRQIPIRIGVNSGSLEKHILQKYGAPTAQALVESAKYHARLLEKFDFEDIVISIKSSDVRRTVEAYRLLSEDCPYPLHLGVTEAGTESMGIVKSSIGIGALLLDGIGDTIRVSLTADPVREVLTGKRILRALGLGKPAVNIVSCPTCGRTKIDLISLANAVEEKLADCPKDITVAVMGSVVNGPGEAREADLGVAGGDGCGLIFRKGEILRKVPETQLLDVLMEEIEKI